MKTALLLATLFLTSAGAFAAPETVSEMGDGSWKFPTMPRPSRSDIARDAKITVFGNSPAIGCLPADALHNGVLPREGKQAHDFFTFSDENAESGKIVMDLGKLTEVAAVAAYSWHGIVSANIWKNNNFDGCRGPQVYTLYGSASDQPSPADLASGDWTKIAEVDNRPPATQKAWNGQYGSFVRDDKGASLGKYRWLVWDVKRTLKPGKKPAWTGTWFAEFDVHTPETLKLAGDAVLAGSELDTVVVAFKTHFDIGFTHPAPAIIKIYRTRMIDHALDLIDRSRKLPPEQRFAWTIPSWVAWQLLWPGQTPERRARILGAITEGSLVVHAIPVTLQTESLEPEDIVTGLTIDARVARELGCPLSRAGKMTDVPSHSWFLPTALKHAGVDFLHIGCNPGTRKPDVPLLYRWEGPDGSSLLTMHNQGYGSDNEFGRGIYPPKDWPYKHWLALIMTSDNEGPPSPGSVTSILAEARRNLPGVKIKLGKMEDFADDILAEEKAGAILPVVRTDMPDGWIHGMGSMPASDALAHRARPKLADASKLATHLALLGSPGPDIRESLFTARERSMMYGEHTWGGSKNLYGKNTYSMQDFAGFLKKDPTALWLEKTWKDHADYITESAAIADDLAAKSMARLAANVAGEGRRAVVFNPLPRRRDALIAIDGIPMLIKDLPPSGYKTVKVEPRVPTAAVACDTAVLENERLKVVLDRVRGGIVSIVDKKTSRELVDPKTDCAFGQYRLQRFSLAQCLAYHDDRLYPDGVYGDPVHWNVRSDLPADFPASFSVPDYARMSVRKDAAAQTAELCASASVAIASKVTTVVTLPAHADWLEISIRLDDKQPDYRPEQGEFYFPVNAKNPKFRIGRLGGVADPVKDFARGSNRTYGYVNTGAMVAGEDGRGVGICPLDHGLMSFGDKGLGIADADYVPTLPVAHVSLFNNLWSINFPYWIGGTVVSRVRVWPTDDLAPAGIVVPAEEARHPPFVAVVDGPGGKWPAEQTGLTLSRPGVRLSAFEPNPDGEGTLLRLWDQTGETGEVAVTLPSPCPFTQATPVNLRGEKTGGSVALINGRVTVRLDSYAPATIILK